MCFQSISRNVPWEVFHGVSVDGFLYRDAQAKYLQGPLAWHLTPRTVVWACWSWAKGAETMETQAALWSLLAILQCVVPLALTFVYVRVCCSLRLTFFHVCVLYSVLLVFSPFLWPSLHSFSQIWLKSNLPSSWAELSWFFEFLVSLDSCLLMSTLCYAAYVNEHVVFHLPILFSLAIMGKGCEIYSTWWNS